MTVYGTYENEDNLIPVNLQSVAGTNLYRGLVNLTEQYYADQEDALLLTSLRIHDQYGNRSSYFRQDYLQSFEQSDIDFIRPSKVLINVSSSEVELDETITLEADLGGEISEVSSLSAEYRSESGRPGNVRMTYNPETGLYEGEFHYDSSVFSINNDRVFTLDGLEIEFENNGWVFLPQLMIESDDIYLVNADKHEKAPEIDLNSIEISDRIINGFGSATLSVNVQSDVDISEVEVVYEDEAGKRKNYWMHNDDDSGVFNKAIPFSTSISDVDGEVHKLVSIIARDSYGNVTQVERNNHEEAFSAADVQVNALDEMILSLSSDTIEPKGTVGINLAMENHPHIRSIQAVVTEDSGRFEYVNLSYNAETELYEGEFLYDTRYFYLNEHRQFEVEEIVLRTLDGQRHTINARSLPSGTQTFNLIDIDFYYGEAEIDLDSLAVGQTDFINRVRTNVHLDIRSEVELSEVKVSYMEPAGYGTTVYMQQFKDTEHFYGHLNYWFYNDEDLSKLELTKIEVTDIYGNVTTIRRNQHRELFANMDMTVTHDPTFSDDNWEYEEEVLLLAESFTSSRQEATTGDDVHFSFALDNKEFRDNIKMNLHDSDKGTSLLVEFHYSEDTGLFEAVTVIDESWVDGDWKLTYFNGEDKDGKWTYVDIDDYELLDRHSSIIKIHDHKEVPSEPVIQVNSLELSQDELYYGETLKMTADLQIDFEGTLERIFAHYFVGFGYDGYMEYIDFEFNPDTNLYESSFEMNYNYPSSYFFDNFVAVGEYGLRGRSTTEEHQDIDGNFITKDIKDHKDHVAPVVDYSALEMSKDIINQGDSINLSIPVSHADMIEAVTIEFYNSVSGYNLNLPLVYNEELEVFELVIDSKELASGVWGVSGIDIKGLNPLVSNSYYRYGEAGQFLGELDFMVLNSLNGGESESDDDNDSENELPAEPSEPGEDSDETPAGPSEPDEEDESGDSDVSPELPEGDTEEDESDDLDQDEPESDVDADSDNADPDEDSSSDQDTDDESDEDNEDETDSEEEAGSDVPADNTDGEANEDDSDSDVEDNDEDQTEHDSEEIVEENDTQETDDAVEEETDGSASEENDLESGDTGEPANDQLESPSSEDENDTEEEASTEENDSETVDSETTEVEEAVEFDAEENKEDVDSSTVLPDTATATWTIGMASIVSLMSGLGLRFVSKKKRKQ